MFTIEMMKYFKLKRWWWWLIAALVVVALLWWWLREPAAPTDRVTVAPSDVEQIVTVIGTVAAATDTSLAFETAGRVVATPVVVGQTVKTGEALIRLDTATLEAQLAAARAAVALKRAEAGNTSVNVSEVTKEQDQLVMSAYRTLLSSNLVAVPSSANYDLTSPLITGRYTGSEGQYKIRILRKTGGVDDFELLTFGAERSGPILIEDNEPTPFGTQGLFISFPDDVLNYNDTTWYVDIPNRSSSDYAANYNAYREAMRTRDRVISEAEARVTGKLTGLTVAEAEVAQAEAEVRRLEQEIAQRTLRSPIDGVVALQDAEVGELVSAGVVVAKVISANNFEIESKVPEAEIAKLAVGNKGTATLDAYGEALRLPVTVTQIDPAETVVNDVATYKITVQFDSRDERIRSGMTANVNINSASSNNALAIPVRALIYDDRGPAVYVATATGSEKRSVTTGILGVNGLIEILSGLEAGEVVLTDPPRE